MQQMLTGYMILLEVSKYYRWKTNNKAHLHKGALLLVLYNYMKGLFQTLYCLFHNKIFTIFCILIHIIIICYYFI